MWERFESHLENLIQLIFYTRTETRPTLAQIYNCTDAHTRFTKIEANTLNPLFPLRSTPFSFSTRDYASPFLSHLHGNGARTSFPGNFGGDFLSNRSTDPRYMLYRASLKLFNRRLDRYDISFYPTRLFSPLSR